MNDSVAHGLLADEESRASQWERESARRALDELFSLTSQYRSTKSYYDLIQFVGRFRFYAPFNAMLLHVQMPGARYVASPSRWLHGYGRRIKPGARPLIILQPMGPVMFVFDVSDTEAGEGRPSCRLRWSGHLKREPAGLAASSTK